MKKIIAVLIAVVCMFATTGLVQADSSVYNIDEIGMQVSIPDEYMVFTRDMAEDDPNLEKLQVTKEYIVTLFEQNGIYLNAFPENFEYEIMITILEMPGLDYDVYDQNVLKDTFMQIVIGQMESNGITVESYSSYEHEQVNMMKFYFYYEPMERNGIQYSGMSNGKFFNITIGADGVPLPEDADAILTSIVNSAVFEEIEEVETETYASLSDLQIGDTIIDSSDAKKLESKYSKDEEYSEEPIDNEKTKIIIRIVLFASCIIIIAISTNYRNRNDK